MRVYRNRSRLWSESPTSFNYATTSINFTQSKRFERDSIYWPPKNEESISAIGLKNMWDDEIKAISKRIDQQQKQDLLNESKPKRKFSSLLPLGSDQARKKNKSGASSFSQFNKTAASRLFQKMPKGRTSPKRDKHGNRSNQIINQSIPGYSQQQLFSNISKSKRKGLFSYSKRIDLSRPDNFYPGPGSYSISRYLDSSNPRRVKLIDSQNQQESIVKSQKQKNKKLTQNKIQTMLLRKLQIHTPIKNLSLLQ